MNRKYVQIRERTNPTNEYEAHLKHLVFCNGKLVGEHAELETAEQHKKKIMTPVKPPIYKGKKLI